jgi:hypothetical protein
MFGYAVSLANISIFVDLISQLTDPSEPNFPSDTTSTRSCYCSLNLNHSHRFCPLAGVSLWHRSIVVGRELELLLATEPDDVHQPKGFANKHESYRSYI